MVALVAAWVAFVGALLALATPADAAAIDAGKAPDEAPLVFLSEAAHPPYAFWNDQGQMAGFEIDLVNAICARIKRVCLFKHKEFERLVPALLSGKGDAIVSSLEVTEERREKFTLSDPYFRMPILMVARKDGVPKALTPEALAGQSIGALRDSAYASLVEERFPNSQLQTYATQIEANLDLAAERLDLVIGDELDLRDWLKGAPEAGCCISAGRVEDPDHVAGEGFAVVMRQGSDALKAKIDKALREMRADGSYAAIARKYFDFDL